MRSAVSGQGLNFGGELDDYRVADSLSRTEKHVVGFWDEVHDFVVMSPFTEQRKRGGYAVGYWLVQVNFAAHVLARSCLKERT